MSFRPWFLFLFQAFLLACSASKAPVTVSSPPAVPVPPPPQETPESEVVQAFVHEQVEATATAIMQDSDDSALVNLLAQKRLRSEIYSIVIDELRLKPALTAEERVKLAEAQRQLERLRHEIKQAIEDSYDEVTRLNFVVLNHWKLTPDMKIDLTDKKPAFAEACSKNRRILVYGYGCPKGSEEETLLISEGRAREVANWIKKNTPPCKERLVRDRGLGILIPELLLQNIGTQASEELLARSRHVRILLPKEDQ